MKKFLAILTIVAMLSSMVVIGASADTSIYAFEEDFDNDYQYFGANTRYAHPNYNNTTGANCIMRTNNTDGVYAHGYSGSTPENLQHSLETNGNGSAIKTHGFYLKVSDFFNGKPAGTYTVSLDCKVATEGAGDLSIRRYDVGKGVSAYGGSYFTNAEGFNNYGWATLIGSSSNTDSFGTVSLTLPYSGSVSEITHTNGQRDANKYDLVLFISAGESAANSAEYYIDNIRVTEVFGEPEAALESTVAPLVIEDAYTEDFTDYTAVGEATPVADSRWNSTVADASLYNKDVPAGIYAHGYTSPVAEARRFAKVDKTEQDTAIEAPGFYIKVPEFFKDKQAGGTFTVSFDAKAIGHTSTLYVRQYIPGATCNIYGNGVYFKNEAGFSNYGWKAFSGGNTSDWTHASVTIEYTGACVVDVTNAGDSAKTDKYALCLLVSPGQDTPDGTKKYYFDNITVTPVDNTTGTVVDYAGKDMLVNNTVYVNNGAPLNAEVISVAYDQNGNLRAVGTAPVAIDAGEANKTANVTIEDIPAGITANWTFKSFLWSDLDNEIEPLYDAVNPFDANVKQSIGVEFNPVTSVPDDYTSGTFTMAKDWVSNGAYCLTDYALNGRYSMFIPNGKSAYLVDDGFLAANGEGVYTVRVWFAGANTLLTRLNMNGKSRRHNGDTDPFPNNSTHVKENGANVSKTVNGKTYHLHEVTLETALLTGDSSKEPQGFKFGAYNGDKWVEVESIVFTPAQ